MKNNPLVSVIMPAYNCEKYIVSSIKSILEQTLSDLELIIINDCSSDSTEDEINKFDDPRIIYQKNQSNSGASRSRNIALKMAKGQYIAIQDADDIAEKNRFQIQAGFLNSNPEYGLVGGKYHIINHDGVFLRDVSLLLTDTQIRNGMLIQDCFGHGSVMFKKELLAYACYNEKLAITHDYEFLYTLMKHTKVANIDEFLYSYRVHMENVTNRENSKLSNETKYVRNIIWNDFLSQNINAYKIYDNFIYSFPKYVRIDYAEVLKDIGYKLLEIDRKRASKYFLASYLYEPLNQKRLARYFRSIHKWVATNNV